MEFIQWTYLIGHSRAKKISELVDKSIKIIQIKLKEGGKMV